MSYDFKLKSAFINQKCTLKSIKSAVFLFSAPCPFLNLVETVGNIFFFTIVVCVISLRRLFYAQENNLP